VEGAESVNFVAASVGSTPTSADHRPGCGSAQRSDDVLGETDGAR
jgi:hypothetical protein